MGLLKYLIVLFLVSETFSAETNVNRAFRREEIVPDVLMEAPTRLCRVVYRAKGRDVTVRLGNKISILSTRKKPSVVNWDANPRRNYTLVMIDPDVPSRNNSNLREVKLWVVVNILGSNISKGTTLASFLAPNPAAGTGPHRYIYLIFTQPMGLVRFNERPIKMRADRFNFSTKRFARKYKLTLFAGNFHIASPLSSDEVETSSPGGVVETSSSGGEVETSSSGDVDTSSSGDVLDS